MKLLLAIIMVASSTAMLNAQEYFYQYPSVTHSTAVTTQAIETAAPAKIKKTSQPKTYKQAYKDAQNGDKPLLILVTADWCPPCQQMKQTTIPRLMQKDAFKDFHYATVDYDAENRLARQLIGNRGLPQIIMFEKQDGEWVRRYLKGIQTTQTVEAFFAQAKSHRTASAKAAESQTTVDKK